MLLLLVLYLLFVAHVNTIPSMKYAVQQQDSPVPINCVIIGDYQTINANDPGSMKENDLISQVIQTLFNDPTIDFHASLNYFGSSSYPKDKDHVNFTTMLDKYGLMLSSTALRVKTPILQTSINEFVEWLNGLISFEASNRCLLFFSAVHEKGLTRLTKTDIYDSIIAIGLNNNTIFPFAPTYLLKMPWESTYKDVQTIVGLVKQPFVDLPTPTPSLTTSTIVTTTTPKISTTTIMSENSIDNNECKCLTEKVWNDVIFVIDRSRATGVCGFSEMYDTMLTVLSFFNVQAPGTVDRNHLRVGVVFYNTEAVLAAPLGSTYEDLLNLKTDSFFQRNDSGNNLETGLRHAVDQFDPSNPNRRSNARKVIVVMATTYNPTGFRAPQTIAAQFRGDNGILITYDYVEYNGEPAYNLGEIASRRYAFNSNKHGIDDLLQAQCSANCFCQLNDSPFTEDERRSPTGGCYRVIDAPANENFAERNCAKRHRGTIVQIENEEKNEFVANLMKTASNNLIGLKWNTTSNQWSWMDGSGLSSYSNFDLSSAHYPGRDCVYMEKNTNLWKTVDCRQGFKYICESKPCDSMNYCDGEE